MEPYRLPRSVIPSVYELKFEPNLAAATFTGEESITVSILESTSEIVINSCDLQIGPAYLQTATEKFGATVTLDPSLERCHLKFTQPLPTGEASLKISFRGILNDKLRGFYRSQVKNESGDIKYIGVTQFEATYARRAFPCWDEPSFKAVFKTTLVVDIDDTAISNTAITGENRLGQKKVVQFADTVPMSTYLVAFVIGEFESTPAVMVGKTPLRVWCVPGKLRLTEIGLEVAAFSLKFFEDYYGRSYPGDKLDLIAIPDFDAGAMENLGAITFRETALLVDRQATTHNELERVAIVVSHENAHMWFGDLVTMSWWNGLWLNEAFATFMEILAVDAYRPEWNSWSAFGVARAQAFFVDGLKSTRPIEFLVQAPRDADAMFDVLTYEKGGSVLRMIEQFMGPSVFKEGVRIYLKRHAFANTETQDLWEALSEASRRPVTQMMDGWIFHPGFPLVSAKIEGSRLLLEQQRFSYLPNEAAAEQRWQIPLQIKFFTPGGPKVERLLMETKQQSVALPEGTDSVLLNEGGHGFYRARYSAELLQRLIATLSTANALNAIERLNLVSDAWASVLAGLMPLVGYLELTTHFREEEDKNVWTVLLESFHVMNQMLDLSDRPEFEKWVRTRLEPMVTRLGWDVRENEPELTGQLRGDLLRAMGALGNDPEVLTRATKFYTDVKGKTEGVDGSVLAAAIAVIARHGDAGRYQEFWQRFKTAATPQEEQRYLFSLAGFRSPALIEDTLHRTLGLEIRKQDAPFVVRALLGSVHGREIAWKFVKENWGKMNEVFPATGIRRMCGGVASLVNEVWEKDVNDFFAREKVDLGGKTLAQYLEQLRIVVALRDREGVALRNYLKRHSAV